MLLPGCCTLEKISGQCEHDGEHDGPGCGSKRHFPDTPAQSESRAKIVNILIL